MSNIAPFRVNLDELDEPLPEPDASLVMFASTAGADPPTICLIHGGESGNSVELNVKMAEFCVAVLTDFIQRATESESVRRSSSGCESKASASGPV